MKRILIFAGTTEGRQIAEYLAAVGLFCDVCVATEYGEQVIPQMEGLTVHCQRMDQEEMDAFMSKKPYAAVVDATHPYADTASENIAACAAGNGIPYLRLKRRTDAKDAAGVSYVKDSAECAEILKHVLGNILLTTGSKDLSAYCAEEELKSRIYVRVLPARESLDICYDNGLSGRQILAMQGPFTEEMNLAVIRQCQIRCMVTKESGIAGGFAEKAAAAEKAGIRMIVIGNPDTGSGLSMGETIARLEEITGCGLKNKRMLKITLAGAGMGDAGSMTEDVRRAIDEADLVFGAPRLLNEVPEALRTVPCYLPQDIISCLERYMEETYECQTKICVLFSGDSGFYSGCRPVYEQLKEWGQTEPVISSGTEVSVRVLPGISSVSYLAAAAGVSWDDATIISLHGKEDVSWKSRVLSAVRYHQKTFLLLSGASQLRQVARLLSEFSFSQCLLTVGYQLSYEEESIVQVLPTDCEKFVEEGLYTCLICNPECTGQPLSPGLGDGFFERGKVPMTKEEIRAVSICKLRLSAGSVVYDIGSGTGSVSAEIGRLSPDLCVYAVEKKEEAVKLTQKNCDRLGLDNVRLITQEAPEGLTGLPAATHAFIGGSGGRLKEILEELYRKNPEMRIVINAASLETMEQIQTVLKGFPVREEEIIQVNVSRCKKAGEYHIMQGENPVQICSFYFKDRARGGEEHG